jgi:threonyl-tRNA synthetase
MYKDGYHSYRDLPIRIAELGTVYRWVCVLEGEGGPAGVVRCRVRG